MGALPPPPGVTPNFVDPPSARGAVVAVIIACLVISTLCIGLRVAAKASVRFGNAGWDDCESPHQPVHIFFSPVALHEILLTLLPDTSVLAWVGRSYSGYFWI